MKETLIYDLPNEPEGMGAFDNQDEPEEEAPWCPLCKEGEYSRNIKVCDECISYYNKYNKL